jgi:uncharacterized protein (UPF0305 family)
MKEMPKKPQTMWERYQNRAAIRPTNKHVQAINDMRTATIASHEMFEHILEMLNDHAANIDALKQELKDTKEFMDWAITTHEGILNEYNAVKDVVAATGSDASFNKLLEDWAKS